MKISFTKFQGTGNDFVMIDNRAGNIGLSLDQIVFICDRKFGIGSDGLILLSPDKDSKFYMDFYNPDGSQSFCGNGSRCAVKFAQSLGLVENSGMFKAIDGVHEFRIEHVIRIRMNDVTGVERCANDFVLNTGSPHYIIFSDQIDTLDLVTEGRKVRYSERFSESGINVNFVREQENGIAMRTYERGVEDETLSCGTGVTAAALSFAYLHPDVTNVPVSTRGGNLEVNFVNRGGGTFSDIWLSGPAEEVFNGEITLK